MKVMHIMDSLNRGGAEVLALDVCRNARAAGLELTFVATGGGDLEEDFRNSGVDFVRLQRRAPVDLRLAARLRRVVRERGVRVVHTHQAVEALHAHLATLGTKVKRVMSFHLCEADAKNRAALKLLAPLTDANVAVSRDLLRCLHTQAGFDTDRNFRAVYNGVDARRLRGDGRRVRDELKLHDSHLLLGMVGNFYADRRKDQLTVCRALVRVFAREPRAHFAFVGARDTQAPRVFEECVEFCREHAIGARVHFLGKRADIPDILDALDVFVLSSRHEGLGIAAVEAMMTGTPAVVSDLGPLLEVAGGGEYAAVFRAGDSEDLSERLLELVGDSARRARLGERGREWAQTQFGIEAHLASLGELYASLAPPPGGRGR
ncbi:MAG TPA: glycosyltransferase family 4 protein [Pyrinomonadaceae bacterium]|nr:glycosyltransferase family 4 protein [Pyrinomonadaceae bacterium]